MWIMHHSSCLYSSHGSVEYSYKYVYVTHNINDDNSDYIIFDCLLSKCIISSYVATVIYSYFSYSILVLWQVRSFLVAMEQLARLGIMSTSTELYSLSLALLSGELYIQKRNKLESISEGEKKKKRFHRLLLYFCHCICITPRIFVRYIYPMIS